MCEADADHSQALEGLCFDLPPAPFAPLLWCRPSAVHGAGEIDLSRSRRSLLLRDLRSSWLRSSDPCPLLRGLGDLDLLILLGDLLEHFLDLEGDRLDWCESDSVEYEV